MPIGIYARYSTADQSETSIEDQVRRCRKTIAQKKITVSQEMIFQDSAISGSAKALLTRSGYAEMLQAIESKRLTCLVVDEISRLSRDPLEIIRITELIDKHNIIFLTSDGMDSRTPDWRMRIALVGIMGKAEIDNIRHQTKRGLQGQLERGYMIAAPAYGYSRIRINALGLPAVTEEEAKGTTWEINETKATIVRRIYAQKASGKSLGEIARELNAKQVPPPRQKKGGDSAWLVQTVRQLMQNTIYKGLFVFNGSAAYRATHKSRADVPQEYKRPTLRLVSDVVWHQCNPASATPMKKNRNNHFLTNLVTCGLCNRFLCMTSRSHKRRALYCAACERKKTAAAAVQTQTISVSIDGVQALLQQVINEVIGDPEVFSAYQQALRSKLTSAERDRFQSLQKELQGLGKTYQYALDQYVAGDDTLAPQVELLGKKQSTLKAEHDLLEKQLQDLNEVAIKQQLLIKPNEVIEKLLGNSGAYQHRLHPILKRLFPSIRLIGRLPDKTAVFEVQMDLGLAVATASGTNTIVKNPITRTYGVRASKSRPVVWTVEQHIN